MPKRKVDRDYELAKEKYSDFVKQKRQKTQGEVKRLSPIKKVLTKTKRTLAAVKNTRKTTSDTRKSSRVPPGSETKHQVEDDEDSESVVSLKQEKIPCPVIHITESTDIEMAAIEEATTITEPLVVQPVELPSQVPPQASSVVPKVVRMQEPEQPSEYISSAPRTPPRALSKKKYEFGSPLPQASAEPPPKENPRYAGLNTIQVSLLGLREEMEEELPLAPVTVPVVEEEHEDASLTPRPKSSKNDFFFLAFSIVMAFVSFGAAVYFGSLGSFPQVTIDNNDSAAPCPPGGRCLDGELYECIPNLQVLNGVCVLEDSAAVKIKMIDRLLQKYSFDHIRTNKNDDNPYFARQEQGRPLYYLASVAKALQIQADAELLYAANILQDTFLISGGFLVGVHPNKAIQGSVYAHAQVFIRTVASTISFLVWSVLVTLFAIYSSWFRQAKILTIFATVGVLYVLLIATQIYRARQALYQQERRVLEYRKMVFLELHKTRGQVEAEVVMARVLAKAFPSNRQKREQLKKDVWRHILRDAADDGRIRTEIVQGKTFWEWTDSEAPTW
jgi:hypothetical protein